MTVHLEAGMTAIRRDGERVGQVVASVEGKGYPFEACGTAYEVSGKFWFSPDNDSHLDIIAAGYPWATLGAQVGDTVRCVWAAAIGCGGQISEFEHVVGTLPRGSKDSLYVMVSRAAKPERDVRVYVDPDMPQVSTVTFNGEQIHQKPVDKPRASHKLNLQDGDVVELTGWQDGQRDCYYIGKRYVVAGDWISEIDGGSGWLIEQTNPKGHRPLFRVISRASWAVDGMGGTIQQPDEVIVVHTSSTSAFGRTRVGSDTHRFTITFPHGSDIGTVTREKL